MKLGKEIKVIRKPISDAEFSPQDFYSQIGLYEVLLIAQTLDSNRLIVSQLLIFVNFYVVIFSYLPRLSKKQTIETIEFDALF